jgi:hypothetical protein
MSKGSILIVVNKANKKAIEAAVKKAKPSIDELGELCQFSFEYVEVELAKNTDLVGLQPALDLLGEDDYAYCVTVERLETLDIYGSPKKFGLGKLLEMEGYKKTIH